MKSIFRIVGVTLLAGIVILCVAVFYFIRGGYARGLLIYELEKYTGMAVSFQSMGGNPLRGLTLHDSAVTQRGRFMFSARLIRLNYTLRKAAQRPFSVRLSVNGGALTLRQESGSDIRVRAVELNSRFVQEKDAMQLRIDGSAVVNGSSVTIAASASGRTLREVSGNLRLELGKVATDRVIVGSTTVSAQIDRGIITIRPFTVEARLFDPETGSASGRALAISSGTVDISGETPVVHLAVRAVDAEFQRVRFGSVELTADGAGKPDNPLRFALKSGNASFAYGTMFTARAAIDVTGSFVPGRADVSGDIKVLESLTTISKVRKQPVSDVVIVRPGSSRKQAMPGGGSLWSAAAVDLRLTAPANNRVEGSGLKAEMTADLRLVKERAGDPALTGLVRVERGTFAIGSRRLTLNSGLLSFTGGTRIDPQVSAEATGRAGDIMVTVNVQGTVSRPRISLTSDPAMSESDILSYLVLGKPPHGLSGQEQATVQKSAITLFSDLAARELRDVLGQDLAPDVVSVQNLAAGGQRASVGKYVNDRLFVTYEWWWGSDEGRQTIIEYRINRRFTLLGQTGYEKTEGADLLWTHEY